MVPAAIQAFLYGAMPRLRAQERLVGVASGGSWISGEMDERSDLDLVLVTQDDAFPQVMQERMQLAKTLGPLLVAFTGEHVGEPRLLICLYGPSLLHVDLKFMALRDFGQRVENPDVLWERNATLTAILAATQCRWPVPQLQCIEDRFWVWVHYAAAKLARGELFEVIDMLSFLRAQVLGPLAVQDQGHRPQGVRRVETRAAKWVAALENTVALHDSRSCGAAIQAAVKLYQELRENHANTALLRHAEAEARVIHYLESIL